MIFSWEFEGQRDVFCTQPVSTIVPISVDHDNLFSTREKVFYVGLVCPNSTGCAQIARNIFLIKDEGGGYGVGCAGKIQRYTKSGLYPGPVEKGRDIRVWRGIRAPVTDVKLTALGAG